MFLRLFWVILVTVQKKEKLRNLPNYSVYKTADNRWRLKEVCLPKVGANCKQMLTSKMFLLC